MFVGLTERFRRDIQAVKEVIDFHDRIRALLYAPEQETGNDDNARYEPLKALRSEQPKRLEWQIYNHCAALTRLYALYSTFVEELAAEYLTLLPDLYAEYGKLPPAVLRQHRVGIAQILLKLGDDGPYRDLQEVEVIGRLAGGLAGSRPYSLLPKAFFVERQNYRLEALTKLLGVLGLEKVGRRIERHPAMQKFVTEILGDSITFQGELSRFVQLRNEAAHTHVEDVIGIDEVRVIADFIQLLCEIIAEIAGKEVVQRRVALGQLVTLGPVEHRYRNGFVVIVRMHNLAVAVGDEVIILHGDRVIKSARIESIRDNDRDVERIHAADGQELGLRLNVACERGASLGRLIRTNQEEPRQTSLFQGDEVDGVLAPSLPGDDEGLHEEPEVDGAAESDRLEEEPNIET